MRPIRLHRADLIIVLACVGAFPVYNGERGGIAAVVRVCVYGDCYIAFWSGCGGGGGCQSSEEGDGRGEVHFGGLRGSKVVG